MAAVTGEIITRVVALRSKAVEEFDRKLSTVKGSMLAIEESAKQLKAFTTSVKYGYLTVEQAHDALSAPVEAGAGTVTIEAEDIAQLDTTRPAIRLAIAQMEAVTARLTECALNIKASYAEVERGHAALMKSYAPNTITVTASALKYYTDDLTSLIKNSVPAVRPIYKDLALAINMLEGAMLSVERMRKVTMTS
jgi:hypothetical protein